MSAPAPIRGVVAMPGGVDLRGGLNDAHDRALVVATDRAKEAGRRLIGGPAMYVDPSYTDHVEFDRSIVVLCFEWETEPLS